MNATKMKLSATAERQFCFGDRLVPSFGDRAFWFGVRALRRDHWLIALAALALWARLEKREEWCPGHERMEDYRPTMIDDLPAEVLDYEWRQFEIRRTNGWKEAAGIE